MLEQARAEGTLSPRAAEFAEMSVVQLVNLYECLSTMKEVASAMTNRPTFEAGPHLSNAAGNYMDDLFNDIACRTTAVIEALRARRPTDRIEIEYRARTLIQDSAIYADTIPDVAAEAAALAVPGRH